MFGTNVSFGHSEGSILVSRSRFEIFPIQMNLSEFDSVHPQPRPTRAPLGNARWVYEGEREKTASRSRGLPMTGWRRAGRVTVRYAAWTLALDAMRCPLPQAPFWGPHSDTTRGHESHLGVCVMAAGGVPAVQLPPSPSQQFE